MKTTLLAFTRNLKTESPRWIWLIALLLLLVPDQAGAVGACTCARFNDWKDFGCHQSAGGAGAAPSGANNAGGNNASCKNCTGMPRWSVDEPYINLHIEDEPLSYMTSSGQKMAFRWMFVQDYQNYYPLPSPDQVPNLRSSWRLTQRLIPPLYESEALYDMDLYFSAPNPVWNHNRMKEIVFWDWNWETNSSSTNAIFQNDYEALVMMPSGGSYYFNNNVTNQTINPATLLTNVQTGIILQPLSGLGYPTVSANEGGSGMMLGNSSNGFQLVYPDGSKDVFGLAFYSPGTNGRVSTSYALLTQEIDPSGRVTQLGYGYVNFTSYLAKFVPESGYPNGGYYISNKYNAYRLCCVIDSDGRTNTLVYQTNSAVYAWQVSEVDDPFGRKASFTYGSAGFNGVVPLGDDPGQLSSITDTAGLSNHFNYAGKGGMISMQTPYQGVEIAMFCKNRRKMALDNQQVAHNRIDTKRVFQQPVMGPPVSNLTHRQKAT